MRPKGDREGANPTRMGGISRRAHGKQWDRTVTAAAVLREADGNNFILRQNSMAADAAEKTAME